MSKSHVEPFHGFETVAAVLLPRSRHFFPSVGLKGGEELHVMAPSDVEASEYDLGVTSVRLIRVGNVIQIIFSKKLAAEFYYAGASARFKKDEDEWRTR